jgi:hypothetical protein
MSTRFSTGSPTCRGTDETMDKPGISWMLQRRQLSRIPRGVTVVPTRCDIHGQTSTLSSIPKYPTSYPQPYPKVCEPDTKYGKPYGTCVVQLSSCHVKSLVDNPPKLFSTASPPGAVPRCGPRRDTTTKPQAAPVDWCKIASVRAGHAPTGLSGRVGRLTDDPPSSDTHDDCQHCISSGTPPV